MINSLKYIQTILSSTYNTLLSFISLVSSIFNSSPPESPVGYDADRDMSGSNSFLSSQNGCEVQYGPQNKGLYDSNHDGPLDDVSLCS